MGDSTADRSWSVDKGEREWLRLAEFIDPGCEAVRDVIAQAKAKAPNGEFPAYVPPLGWEGSIADLVNCQVKAIYETLRERQIGYAVERWDSSPAAQVIRTHAEVLDSKSIGGPCLDLVLLFAACLEHVGIHPLVVVLESGEGRHAVLGYRLREPSLDPHMPAGTVSPFLSAQQLDELVDKREIEFLGCTGITKGEDVDFLVAKHGNREYLGGWDFFRKWDLKFALDVKVARWSALTRELVTYLEGVRDKALALPTAFGFPADVSFTDIRLPVKLKRGLRRYSEAEARAREVERRQWLDDEARVYHYPWPSQEELERERERPLDWDREVRRRARRAVILGDPGLGKTWLLKHEALLLAEEALGEERLLEIESRGEADQIEAALYNCHVPPDLEDDFRKGGHPLPSPAWLQPADSREWLLVSGRRVLVIRREGDAFALYRPELGEYPLSEPKIRLPIFLPLSSIASQLDRDPNSTFEDALLAALELGTTLGKELKRWVTRAWNEGNIVLLLDAMDEVPSASRELLYTKLENFARKYPRVRILVTSRIVGYSGPPFPRGAYEEFEILPFDRRQQWDFVRIWFGRRPERASAFLAELRRVLQVRALARIPLLLALMCRLFNGREELPKSRAEIYGSCIRAMLRQDWRKPPLRDDPHLNAKLELLEELGFELFQKGKELFSLGELEDQIKELLEERPSLKKDLKDKSPRELSKELQDDGILIKAGAGEDPPFLFLHLTFQEYLAACALARRVEPVELDGEEVPEWLATVKPRLFSPRWREVILLLAAMLEDATPLVQAIWQEPEDIFLDRLFLAGGCLAYAQNVEAGLFKKIADEVFTLVNDTIVCTGGGLDKGDLLKWICYQKSEQLGSLLGLLAGAYEAVFEKVVSAAVNKRERVFIYALSESRRPEAMEYIHGLLKDPDPCVREAATEALGRSVESEKLVHKFMDLVEGDPDPTVRETAANVLGKIGDDSVASHLITLLKDPDMTTVAITALKQIVSENSLHDLIGLIEESDSYYVKAAIALMIGKIGNKSVLHHLVKMLTDPHYTVKLAASNALGKLGDEKAVNLILELLQREDIDENTINLAIRALGEIGGETAERALIAMLREGSALVRSAAALALGNIGSQTAVREIVKLLKDDNPEVRWSAARALGDIKSVNAVPALMERIQTETGNVRTGPHFVGVKVTIAWALGEIGDPQAVQVLEEFLSAEDYMLVCSVAKALAKLGHREGVDALGRRLIDSKWSHEKIYVLQTLREIGDYRAEKSIIPFLRSPSLRVRNEAVWTLAIIGDEAAVPPLLDLLQQGEPVVEAVGILAKRLGIRVLLDGGWVKIED